MPHHISLGTNDLRRAKPFYDAVFAVLGLRMLGEGGLSINYGIGEVMCSLETPVDTKPASVGKGPRL